MLSLPVGRYHPSGLPGGSGGTWLVSLINKDETRSGQVEISFAQLSQLS